jgi:1-acyl-sn-glycerol-3-phosphate acyltransferase
MPPPPIRRPLTVTTWLVLSILVLCLSPVLLAVGALASRVLHRPQPALFARLLIAYFAHELGVLVACGALWTASGFGAAIHTPRFQDLHERLLRWFVHGLTTRVVELLGVEIAPQPSPDAVAALEQDGPVLFFSRHAGPGDTLLLTDQLMTRYRRVPRVVFKEALALDPSVDLIAHRLPHAVLNTSDKDECERRIEQVTAELGPRGTLLLFPEGANFTPERRRNSLAKLRRKGRRQEAQAGEAMQHVLPPHPGGALAALRANPEAVVVFAAHTGLGLAAFPGQIWRHPPIGRTLKTRMWLSTAAERPRDPNEQVKWLYDWWERLDSWLGSEGERVQAGA